MMAAVVYGGEMRVFHSAEGKPLKASFEGMSGGNMIKLRREDGKEFELPKERLSEPDRKYIEETVAHAGDDAKRLNEAAGHEFANGTPFAGRQAEEIAGALKLKPESQSKYSRSWRLYAAFVKDYRLFGAMPYSVALYADASGAATNLSVVYANKGDFGSKAGFGADHFNGGSEAAPDSLAEAMTRDEEMVSKALTEALGPGKEQRFGEGKTRRTVRRWDWNGHSFLLSSEENEYVSLSVVPTDYADAGGRSARVKDTEVKQRLLDSVVREDNGDVFLSEIPMVNQGPKGYCVPATFERAMRTMGIDADMYLLAMVGQSSANGGTVVELLLENVRSQVYRKGRRTKDDHVEKLRIRDVKRYLDSGIPIMWTMCSMEEYNKCADQTTASRKNVQDWKAYAEELTGKAAEFTDLPKPDDRHHICMIVGYNDATQEIAVSDSWGDRFERRWVPLAVADWANTGGLFMILP
jgi:hypothetical protein